jgi:hypothetical protein
MQKKQLILIVVSLGIVSTLFFNRSRGYHNSFINGMMGETSNSIEFAPTEMAESKGMIAEPDVMMGILPRYYEDEALDVSQRSYQKSSYHSVIVSDVSSYISGMKDYFSSIEGVVLNSTISTREKYNSASLYVKVPIAKFDEATSKTTQEVKKIIDESINSDDITGQVVRTDDNLISLQEQKLIKEAQLKDAKTELEKAKYKIDIERLERQIVSAQKNQENVKNKTEYASVSITAASNEKYFNPNSTGDFNYEVQRAWESLKSFAKVSLVFGIWIAVYSIIWAPVIWIFGKITAKFKQ